MLEGDVERRDEAAQVAPGLMKNLGYMRICELGGKRC